MQAEQSTPAFVLLLDDDQEALEEIQEILELEDLSSVAAATAEAAMDALSSSPSLSIVVTDVHIAGPDGITNGMDFIAQAREKFPDRALSFIVLSGDAGAITASIETGAVDFLTKPLMPEALLSAIQNASSSPSEDNDLSSKLMRKVEETTRSLQRVSVDLADRERELSVSREAYERRRLQGGKLRKALAQGHILPWFQPQVCAQTGALQGFEALVRWADPVLGMQNPAEFLPLAQEIGFMTELDTVIQRHAFGSLSQVHRLGFNECDVGINLTASQLAEPGLVDYLSLEVDRAGLQPQNVAIEILESAMLDEAAADPIKVNVNRLGRLGFGIDLDDFGTGHAGLSSLRDLAVTRIKIDRSFVQNVDRDAKLQKFTRALINLAKTLEINVLAEGVETEQELTWLRDEGCDAVQGFFIAKPMPIDAAMTWAESYCEAPSSVASSAG
ncbi:MAG: EAL domain-containing protein [Pseudomonadota bacterium]